MEANEEVPHEINGYAEAKVASNKHRVYNSSEHPECNTRIMRNRSTHDGSRMCAECNTLMDSVQSVPCSQINGSNEDNGVLGNGGIEDFECRRNVSRSGTSDFNGQESQLIGEDCLCHRRLQTNVRNQLLADRRSKNGHIKHEVAQNVSDSESEKELSDVSQSNSRCNAYEHKACLIHGISRNGIHQRSVQNANNVPVSVVTNGASDLNGVHGVTYDFDNKLTDLTDNMPSSNTSLIAPLAVAESLSDDDSAIEHEFARMENAWENCENTENCILNSSDSMKNSESVIVGTDYHLNNNVSEFNTAPAKCNVSQLPDDVTKIEKVDDKILEGNVYPNPESVIEIVNIPVIDETFELHDSQNSESSASETENFVEEALEGEHQEGEPGELEYVNQVALPETDLDQDDFIEADLPLNAERLAFYSSDSTSDEDEGCGDEVLPNDEKGEESDNETIDPTDRDYISSAINSEQNMLTSTEEISNEELSNVLSIMTNNIRGEISELYPCNISCDKSTEENDDLDSDGACSDDEGMAEYSPCKALSVEAWQASGADERFGAFFVDYIMCVCCDKPMNSDLQRQLEIGVRVCDKCYSEYSAERNRWPVDNEVRQKLRLDNSCSNNGVHRSINSLSPLHNSLDKVSNNTCANFLRFSSSDSETYDRVNASDTEVTSPDGDAGSIFQSSSSNGTSVQYRQFQDTGHLENRQLHRQSLSLEYPSSVESLYCQYYTPRSRSLDRGLRLHVDDQINRSPNFGAPYVAIASNSHLGIASISYEKSGSNNDSVFDKPTYNVVASLPNCSSSDEEENIHVPEPDDRDDEGNDDDDDFVLMVRPDLAANMDSACDNVMFRKTAKHSKSQKMRMDEHEPIYEDIDNLELLVDDMCLDVDAAASTRAVAQPSRKAVSQCRQKRRLKSPTCDVEKVMVWNEYEAYVVQVKQIGTSACGPTAVLNVLKAFDFQVEKDEVAQTIKSNLRMEAAPIPYYLFSRYSAGTTSQELVNGVASITRGAIMGRFFHFYPQRDVELLKWLGYWMKKGAVPVATLNLQQGVKPGWTIPDAWHHQMVYGVSSKGVYLTNPLEIVPESVIMEQLTSDSVLLIRRQDVVGRFRDWCPLNEIIQQSDTRWRTMNILGQVVHMLREQCMPIDQLLTMKSQLTTHICIPAAYKAGITLFMRSNSDAFEELMTAPELLLKHPHANK